MKKTGICISLIGFLLTAIIPATAYGVNSNNGNNIGYTLAANPISALPEFIQPNYFNYFGQWNDIYSYSDEYSEGGIEYINPEEDIIEVTRTYAWRNTFNKLFVGKVKITEYNDNFELYGARLAIINPENALERYEIRFYPNSDKVQINYVDRTDRTGDYSFDEENDLTVSEIITSAECALEEDVWYHTVVMRNGNNWKVLVMNPKNPTCFLEWKDKRIKGNELAIGIQSAGKYVVSRFNKVWAI